MYQVTIVLDAEADNGIEYYDYDNKVNALAFAHNEAYRGYYVNVYDAEENEDIFTAYN